MAREYLDYHGQDLRTRFRFMDTWLRTSDGWHLAARHTAAVLKEPPAISLSVAGQPRSRRIFVRDAAGKVVAFVDRREGEDVRWQKNLEQAPPDAE